MADKSHQKPHHFSLPVEYFSIQRAAKFFECEEEDLWHMREIGAIQFCVKLEGMIPIKAIEFSDNSLQWHQFNGLFEQAFPNRYAEIFRTTENVTVVQNGEADVRSPAYFVDGIWALSQDYDIDNSDSLSLIDKQNVLLETSVESGTDCKLTKTILIRLSLDLDDTLATKLIILRADLKNIFDSTKNGEPLPNRYNNALLRAAAVERIKNRPTERVSSRHALFIRLALRAKFGLDERDLTDAKKVKQIIDNELKDFPDMADDPFSEKTISNWLK
ncbi:hypothetical protein HR45_03020 [Shewanella mangrovi]|uniref:Uncharacterized protein n=1 Tax=Shewanella mangrovi TaxID=1515746 RepID=A0A094JK48_9GAMM|nr:hypothetical protein [Shewanella mangrovi]KFZ38429.1 hypothetical protein HR45_03020 [Shewanella mangrovi]